MWFGGDGDFDASAAIYDAATHTITTSGTWPGGSIAR
jgi:hypothetical protein